MRVLQSVLNLVKEAALWTQVFMYVDDILFIKIEGK